MTRPAAKGKTLSPALVAAAALLLTAPHALASRTASSRSELVPSPALEPPVTTAHALASAYVPQGFELHAGTDPHPAAFALFPALTPAAAAVEPEKLASGVESWKLAPNLQRIQIFVAESWQVREKLGPVDSPNLYQAFGLDPQNNTDPLGLRKPTEFDQRIRRRLQGRVQQVEQQWAETGTASAVLMDTEARPKCLLCTENEYVPTARERSASTEAEYQELRARLAQEIADFDAAVAEADKDDVIHFRGGGLQGEGPYYTVFTKIDAVSNAEAMAWFNVGASEQVAANVAYMTRLIDARNPIVVEPVGVPGSAVGPGERASYGELKARKRAFGETEPLHMDHQPSFAAQVRAREALLGRPLTKSELAALKRSTPAAASPQAVHQETSLTYGGRNTPERIAEDAADLAAAAARDREVFEQAMRARAR